MAKTTVKHWWGNSNNSTKADFTEFPTKREAKEHIKVMERYHKVHGHEMMGASNFYEIL